MSSILQLNIDDKNRCVSGTKALIALVGKKMHVVKTTTILHFLTKQQWQKIPLNTFWFDQLFTWQKHPSDFLYSPTALRPWQQRKLSQHMKTHRHTLLTWLSPTTDNHNVTFLVNDFCFFLIPLHFLMVRKSLTKTTELVQWHWSRASTTPSPWVNMWDEQKREKYRVT